MHLFSHRLTRFLKRLILISLLAVSLSLSPSLSQGDATLEWHMLYPKIRDRLIPKYEAQGKLRALESAIRESVSHQFTGCQENRFCFPLRGYTFHSIGGTRGSGYQVQGYDFFDGSQHRGHPGHDIFIHDRNQDTLDDRTGQPVEVLSVCSGVVVSVHKDWDPSNPIRGGNYIWIYHPVRMRYYYYAHLKEVMVTVGQMVSRGDRLGTVGRTGRNAHPKRSPTHLHFSVHQSIDGYPKPINPYSDLVWAETR